MDKVQTIPTVSDDWISQYVKLIPTATFSRDLCKAEWPDVGKHVNEEHRTMTFSIASISDVFSLYRVSYCLFLVIDYILHLDTPKWTVKCSLNNVRFICRLCNRWLAINDKSLLVQVHSIYILHDTYFCGHSVQILRLTTGVLLPRILLSWLALSATTSSHIRARTVFYNLLIIPKAWH